MAPRLLPGAPGVAEGCPSGQGGGLSRICPDPTTHRAAILTPIIVDMLAQRGHGLLLWETAGPRGTLKSRISFICKIPTILIREPETHKTWVLKHPKSESFPKG